MAHTALHIVNPSQKSLIVKLEGEFSLATFSSFTPQLESIHYQNFENICFDLEGVSFLDSAAAIYLKNIFDRVKKSTSIFELHINDSKIERTFALVAKEYPKSLPHAKKRGLLESLGKESYAHYRGFLSFMAFLGELFATKLHYLAAIKNIRFKEIAFEINESAIKALGIIALTSFLIGVVVAYQSAYQLRLYGANIFIVDMLGLSILRELSPLITAIVIAGRSGSAFSAQIGAMKITEEIDAMRTMGFDPYKFLVLPKIIALMIMMPLLIFASDMAALLGGVLIANITLDITPELFIDRFLEVIALKHFLVGVVKGPFFAFLIASIGIYRGLMVKNDTQSIGFNTTKSVVESLFAIIVCDALFSIAFTNLGI